MNSPKLIFDLVLSFSKLILVLITKWLKAKMEEKIRYYERMKNLKDLIDKMAEDKSEIINEADYLSNLKWEEVQRYEEYKKQSLEVLNSKGGLIKLKNITKFGMHLRITRKEAKILEILNLDLTNEDKSKLIAMEISKNE